MALEQLDYSSCETFYDEVDILLEDYFKRQAHENLAVYAYEDRISGKNTATLIYYILTGERLNIAPYNEYDLKPCYNLYTLASDAVREWMNNLLGEWKARICKDPDLIVQTSLIDEMVG